MSDTQVPPTQLTNPGRASWRTAIFATIAALPIINLAILSLQSILAEYGLNEGTLPGWAWLVLNGAVVISGIAAKWINSLALMPKVNDWMNSLGVGPTPKNRAH